MQVCLASMNTNFVFKNIYFTQENERNLSSNYPNVIYNSKRAMLKKVKKGLKRDTKEVK